MKIAFYTRDESGMISYKGIEDWPGFSLQEVLDHYFRGDETPETEQMMGWPHETVAWYGDLGVGM